MNAHLLIDAGNTRVKWQLLTGDTNFSGAVMTCDLLANQATTAGITDSIAASGRLTVTISNVAGLTIAGRLQAAVSPNAVHFITSTTHCCGVTNHYNDPAQLGTDRFAALIGAYHANTIISRGPDQPRRQTAKLVVMAGTALTIDALTADGVFMGGVIVPGLALMRRSLNLATAQLPPVDAARSFDALGKSAGVLFPRDTLAAITTGTLDAAIGAILQSISRLKHAAGTDIEIVASGGAISLLQPALERQLSEPLTIVDDLVLRGLHLIAVDAENRAGETDRSTPQSSSPN